jgi:AcrR family transcriptional regulator
VRYDVKVSVTTGTRRARSPESKQERAASLLEAARSLAAEQGVASVTLTAIAQRAGLHHSAMRRYYASYKEVLLQLAAQGWSNWSARVTEALEASGPVGPAALAAVMADALAADPLFCDLLANVPLHLEREVPAARVLEFKQVTSPAIAAMTRAITRHVPGLDQQQALDVVTAANALSATLWQASHPSPELTLAYQAEPQLALIQVNDFQATLTRLLAATCTGLAAQ